jgi:hypothetical protein
LLEFSLLLRRTVPSLAEMAPGPSLSTPDLTAHFFPPSLLYTPTVQGFALGKLKEEGGFPKVIETCREGR